MAGFLRLVASRRRVRSLAICGALLLLNAVGSRSAMAQCLPPSAPTIVNLAASQVGPNEWMVTGQVGDLRMDCGYSTIALGGLLAGESCVADENGYFSFGFSLASGQSGLVTAQATLQNGEQSAVAETYILND